VIEIVPPMVDTDLNTEGRGGTLREYRGVSVAEYIPGVMEGLEHDIDTIFHGGGERIMLEPRSVSESRFLNPSR